MHRPVRMCIGCRGRAQKDQLLRVVSNGRGLLLDQQHNSPGRGAYLHPSASCLRDAVRRRMIGRALRVEQLDGRLLVEALTGSVPGLGVDG